MKSLINALRSALFFKAMSLIFCASFAITAFGASGSYKYSFDAIVLFYAVWLLGHGSHGVDHD